MKIVSFITRLTNTAIGQSGTNDSYIYFPKEEHITNEFFERQTNHPIQFIDKRNGTSHTLNVKFSKENRLYNFGPFARANELQPGDELILQRKIYESGTSEYSFDFIRNENSLLLEYFGEDKQFIPWSQERFTDYFPNLPQTMLVLSNNEEINITVESNGLRKRERIHQMSLNPIS